MVIPEEVLCSGERCDLFATWFGQIYMTRPSRSIDGVSCPYVMHTLVKDAKDNKELCAMKVANHNQQALGLKPA